MCLILFAINPSPDSHLILAANRDEQHARATLPADYWLDHDHVLGGRDLVAGGTWLGVNQSGRFAAVTNFAETPPNPIPPRSRGELTADFLTSDIECEAYLKGVQKKAQEYRGFNLLISDGKNVYYYSNRLDHMKKLSPGFYGLSNQLLDCDWPKVIKGKEQLRTALSENDCESSSHSLFQLLEHQGDGEPHTAKFILGEAYGTSVSTVLSLTQGRVRFEERGFDPSGTKVREKSFDINL